MMKSIEELAWDVSEPEYREDKALSYSILAKYEREGFSKICHLFDKVESPSLLLGSCVDSIITGGKQDFDNRFMVADFPAIPNSIIEIVKALFRNLKNIYKSLNDIPDKDIIDYTVVYKYQLNWRPETRAKVIKEKGSEYYSLMHLAEDKAIISTDMYQDVTNMVDVLKSSEATRWYFAFDNPFDQLRRYYQLKFKANFDEVEYKCMVDLLIVDYDKKVIYPIDLKTSGKPEYEFYKSFIDWRYDLQSRLYYSIIRNNLNSDEYFKDFELSDYRFVVVNKDTLNPLVWVCPFTKSDDVVYYGRNYNGLRHPLTVGKELNYYLSTYSKIPLGIEEKGLNDINQWIQQL